MSVTAKTRRAVCRAGLPMTATVVAVLSACTPGSESPAPVADPEGYETPTSYSFALGLYIPEGIDLDDVVVRNGCYGYRRGADVIPVVTGDGRQYCAQPPG